jgi:RNA polymerase sigma-70 factor (ECF subfamily)
LGGDIQAYADLVRKFHPAIYRLCASLLNDSSDADDAAQESFLKAYKSLAEFRQESSFGTWLYRLATNHCLDLLRQQTRRKSVSWEELLEREGERIERWLGQDKSPAADPRRREVAEKILDQLRPEYRVVISMREIDGMSYQDISDTLGITLESVRARLRRARQEIDEKVRHFFAARNV